MFSGPQGPYYYRNDSTIFYGIGRHSFSDGVYIRSNGVGIMFNVFKKVLENKSISVEESKKVNDFILRRWMSGDNRLIGLANTLNCLAIKVDMHTLLVSISKALNGQIKFIKFPQKPKENIITEENTEIVARFFQVSFQEAREYLEWMQDHCPEEIKTLKTICKDLD